MKRTIFFCALLALFTGANAQKTTDYKEKHPYKDWVKLAPKLDDAFFTTPELSVLPTTYCSTSKQPVAGPKTSICPPN